jgi:hypothetical protein
MTSRELPVVAYPVRPEVAANTCQSHVRSVGPAVSYLLYLAWALESVQIPLFSSHWTRLPEAAFVTPIGFLTATTSVSSAFGA